MITVNLGADEVVITKCPDIDFDSTNRGKGKADLFLTNKNIYIQKKNIFGKLKESIKIPVTLIKMFEGKPQIKLNDKGWGEDAVVDLYLNDGQLEIKFDDDEKKAAKNLVFEVYKLLGDKEAVEQFEDNYKVFAFSGVEEIAQTLKGTIETFKDTIIGQQEASEVCKNCGGLINGYSGKVTKCPFCGSSQKLN